MINKPFRIDELHKYNGINDKYANHMWALLYHIMMEIVVSTLNKFGEHIF